MRPVFEGLRFRSGNGVITATGGKNEFGQEVVRFEIDHPTNGSMRVLVSPLFVRNLQKLVKKH